MSFIKRRDYRVTDKGTALSRELWAFLVLLSVWSVVMNVAASMLYASFGDWWLCQLSRPWAILVFAAVGIAVVYSGMVLLGKGLAGSMDDVRRFHLVLPLAVTRDHLGVEPIRGYWVTKSLQHQLSLISKPDQLYGQFQAGGQIERGRPFQGDLYRAVAATVSRGLLTALAGGCEFYLSQNGEFHGADYGSLAKPPGPSPRRPVDGAPGQEVYVPSGCRVRLRPGREDAYGKSVDEVRFVGPFGSLTFRAWPQWALLSPKYHALSLDLVRSNIRPEVKNYSINDFGATSSLWVFEIPIELRVRFENLWWPVFLTTARFETLAAFIDDLSEFIEERWSWEWHVERTVPPSPHPGA